MRRSRFPAVLAAPALVGLALTVPAAPATAATMTVDDPGTAADASPGDGVCATAGGTCTLRAAVEEANATTGPDTIDLPAGSYSVGSRLLIEGDTTIRGDSAATTTITGNDASALFRVRTREYLICDSVQDRIRSYDHNGVLNGTWVPSGAGGLDTPVAAHVGRDDDVFVAGFSSGVHRFDGVTGAHEGVFVPLGSGGLAGPSDAVFGPSDGGTSFSDNLYVTKYQPDGAILRYSGATGASLGTFVSGSSLGTPNSIAFRGGSLYATSVTSNSVLRYQATTGAAQGTFVSSFSGGLSTPRDLLWAPDGSLLVSSWDTDEVLRYSGTTGAFLGELVPSGSGGLDRPTDLAIGHDGQLLVISQGTRQVLEYDIETGEHLGDLVTGGTSSLQLPSCIVPRADVGSGPTVSISRVTLADGDAEAAGDAGAAMITDRGSITTITDGVIRDHSSSSFGGAISNWGRLTLTRVEVRDNALPTLGGGGQTSQGGGIFNVGQLFVNNSTIANNTAIRGGGISNTNQGLVEIRNSTVSGNTAMGGGGGLRNVADGVMRISLTTITDNEANVPGTASGESSRFGGGLQNVSPATVSMGATILAGNTDNRTRFDADFAPDCSAPTAGTISSHRYNVIGVVNSACALRDAVSGSATTVDRKGSDTTPLDPELSPLGSNGGVTRTHPLAADSPAIDYKSAGTGTAFFNCLGIDQRSYSRPADGDGNGSAICDAGAYERNGSRPLFITLPPPIIERLTAILCPPGGPFCFPLQRLTRVQLTLVSTLTPQQLDLLTQVPPRQLLRLPTRPAKALQLRFQLSRDQVPLLAKVLNELRKQQRG